jgi:hypothetical protein
LPVYILFALLVCIYALVMLNKVLNLKNLINSIRERFV